jgi:hypothetical protein
MPIGARLYIATPTTMSIDSLAYSVARMQPSGYLFLQNQNTWTRASGTGSVQLNQTISSYQTARFIASSTDGHIELWVQGATGFAATGASDLFIGNQRVY